MYCTFGNSNFSFLAGCSAFFCSWLLYLHWVGYWSKPWHLVNPKIAGKWMFIPLELIIIGFDPPPVPNRLITNQEGRLFDHPTDGHVGCNSPRMEDDMTGSSSLKVKSRGIRPEVARKTHQTASIHIIYIYDIILLHLTTISYLRPDWTMEPRYCLSHPPSELGTTLR